MTTLVRVDQKNRLCIRGTKKGGEYLVRAEKGGWWVEAVPKAPARKKQPKTWAGSKLSLVEHLRRLAESGLQFEPSELGKQKVPKCRF
jgi:hypothetical protein